jgi:N-acyl-D-aspartate/D-glutamate deacylase
MYCATLSSIKNIMRQLVMHDLVIRGGTLVDGSGNVEFVADLAIDGDVIVAIG